MAVLELSFASGESSLSVRRFEVREAMSAGFIALVWARSSDPDVDLRAIIGQPATFRIESGVAFAALGNRKWDGICNYAEHVQAEAAGLSTYFFRIVPVLWLLTQRRNHRIFQHVSVPDIAARILTEHGVPHTFEIDTTAHPKLEVRIQYGESDYDFLSRLLEEAGIAFTFPDPFGAGTALVLGDAPHKAPPRAGLPLRYVDNPNQAAEKEYVTRVLLSHDVRPGAWAQRDYDLRRPAFSLLAEAPKSPAPEDKYEHHHHEPGGMVVEGGKFGDTPFGDAKGVARHDLAAGKARAERSLVAERGRKVEVDFHTNAPDLWPGVVFLIDGHAHPEIEGKPLLTLALTLEGAPGEDWTFRGRAVPADVPYRPPLRTPKPQLRNVECAIVAGPAGEEIFTDELGRVRVRFPWDREATGDENSSCWIRVSQGWAGAGYGMMHVPRVGQEVLVAFMDGNPDQPVIVGRLFNRPVPVPYLLPAEKTKSGWKSSTSPGSSGYNELLIEDLAGEELLSLQAQKNQRELVKNDETITVVNNRDKRVLAVETDTTLGDRTEVTEKDRKQTIELDRTTVIGGERAHLIKGIRNERIAEQHELLVDKDQHLIVKKEKRERVELDSHVHVDKSRHVKAGGVSISAPSIQICVGKNAGFESGDETHILSNNIVLEGDADVTVKGPGGFIRIDAGGVTIVGTLVQINAGGGPGSGSGVGGAAPLDPKEATEGLPAPTIVSETVATSPGSRSRTKIGVGEEVVLTYTGGTATWTVSGGGTLIPTSGPVVTFRAGERASSSTITATGAPGTVSLAFEVVEPSSFLMEQAAGTRVKHTSGRPDCGFLATLFLQPPDVSFENVEVREQNSASAATGFYLPFHNISHQPAGMVHSAWFTVNPPALGRGSAANLADRIYSGDPGGGPPWVTGSMVFPIVWEFRVAGGAEKALPSTNQNHDVEAGTGKCTSSKGGETKIRLPGDPTSDFV
jgi:type VI secretion system secreted protein VgrG